MTNAPYDYLTKSDGKKIKVDAAERDGDGRQIGSFYVRKGQLKTVGGTSLLNAAEGTVQDIPFPTLSRTATGTGNVVTDVTVSGHAVTVTKGSITVPGITVSDTQSGTIVSDVTVDPSNDHTLVLSRAAVTNSGPTLAWGETSTIGTIGSQALTVTMPTSSAGSDLKPIKIANGVPTPVANDLVDVSSAQTISGAKTFTGAFTIKQDNPWLHLTNNLITRGSKPSANRLSQVRFEDVNGAVVASIQHNYYSDGDATVRIATENTTGEGTSSELVVARTFAGDNFIRASYRNTPLLSNEVLTLGNGVSLTTAQTISGTKTFTGNVYQERAAPQFWLKNTQYSNTSSANANTHGIYLTLNDNVRLASLETSITTTDQRSIFTSLNTSRTSTASYAVFGMFNKDGATWGRSPYRSYASADNSDILVKAHVIDMLAAATNVVHTTGDETVAGSKTFTSPLLVSQAGYAVVKGTNSNVDTSTVGTYAMTHAIQFFDKNDVLLGRMAYATSSPATTRSMELRAYTQNGNNTYSNAVVTYVTNADVKYSTTGWRTIPSGDDEILTRGNGVTLNTAQSIYAGKTFLAGITTGGQNSDGAIEIFHTTPYIDFHHARSLRDWTARIINSGNGEFTIAVRNDDGTGTSQNIRLYSEGYVIAPNRSYASASNSDVLVKAHVADMMAANVGNGQISLTSSRGTAIDSFTVNQSAGKNIVLPASSTQYQNVSVTFAAQSPADFADYPYMASYSVTGLTADMYATVTFSEAQVSSGQYAPFCQTVAGAVRLYAKSGVGAQTIPTISVGMDDSSAQQSMSNFVTLTGDQSISGVKTFSANPILYTTGFSEFIIRSTRTSGNVGAIGFYDYYQGAVNQIISNVNGNMTLKLHKTGSCVRLEGQRAYSSSNTDDVVTIGSLQASTDVVHTSGNEIIGGNKTFSNNINGTTIYGAHESSGARASNTYQVLLKFAKSNISQAGIRGHIGFIRAGRAMTGIDVLQIEFNYGTPTGIGLALPKYFNNGSQTYILSHDTDYVYILKVNDNALAKDSTNTWIAWQWQFFISQVETLLESDMALTSIPGTVVGRI